MSYDVYVAGEAFNYTYNLAQFFKDFGVRPVEWDGQKAGGVAVLIANAFPRISVQGTAGLDGYNPDNDWGSWQGATIWLTDVMVACLENPDATVEAT